MQLRFHISLGFPVQSTEVFLKKVLSRKAWVKDDEMENMFSNFNILLTQSFQRNEKLLRCFLGFSLLLNSLENYFLPQSFIGDTL